jgi:peptidoglycan/LPS O-acetylase OafA/YrhL
MSDYQYRPAVDGIRALAVLSVILFHLDNRLLKGGFVGVDVFFVISGYLITGILYNELLTGNFSFLRFYQRRIARIFPLQVLTTVTILTGAYLVYSPQDFASSGALAMASAFSLTNMKLMFQGSYFDISPDAQPFLHFWSLAVEEQFYLCLPLLLFLFWRFKLSKEVMRGVLLGAMVVSLVFCVILTSYNPSWAFYLLPTRAWELLAGSVLALSFGGVVDGQRSFWRDCLGGAGMILILGSCLSMQESDSFPGYFAIFPVSGTTLLIYGSSGSGQYIGKFLSLSVFRTIGKFSYSLYLWHWPIFCFVDYHLYDVSGAYRLGLKVLSLAFLAVLSYVLFEAPLRKFCSVPSRAYFSYGMFVFVTILIAVGGYGVRSSNYYSANIRDVKNGGRSYFAGLAFPSVVLIGDSNASMYGRTMMLIAKERELNLNIISVDAADPFPSSQLYLDSMKFLKAQRPDVTVFVAAWGGKISGRETDVKRAIDECLQYSRHVVIVEQPPTLPDWANRDFFRKYGVIPVAEASEAAARRKFANSFLRTFESQRVHVIEVESALLDKDGTVLFRDQLGHQMYHDKTHLSGYGTDRIRTKIDDKLLELLR